MLDIDRVEVEVRDGMVFLIGQVDNFAERCAVENAAYRATGRGAMATCLSIKRSRPVSNDTAWVQEVRRSLEHDPDQLHRTSK